jgi:hypothetical protein
MADDEQRSKTLQLSEFQQRAVEALKEHGADKPCPRCGNASFALANGIFAPIIHPDVDHVGLTGKVIPVIAVICQQCGFVNQHALGPLGLMPSTKEEKEKEVAK